MVYEEFSIPAIQKEWESSFVERYRLFTSERDRNYTLEVILREGDPVRNKQLHPVTLNVYVKSDKDAEQLMLGLNHT
jgi:hypothetical protein